MWQAIIWKVRNCDSSNTYNIVMLLDLLPCISWNITCTILGITEAWQKCFCKVVQSSLMFQHSNWWWKLQFTDRTEAGKLVHMLLCQLKNKTSRNPMNLGWEIPFHWIWCHRIIIYFDQCNIPYIVKNLEKLKISLNSDIKKEIENFWNFSVSW